MTKSKTNSLSNKSFFLVVLLAALTICAITVSVGWFGYHRLAGKQQAQQTLSDEEAIRQEFDRHNENRRSAIVDLNVKGDWAVGGILPTNPTTGKILDADPGIAIFKKIEGQWQLIQRSNENYNQILDEVPESLLPSEVKEFFRKNQ